MSGIIAIGLLLFFSGSGSLFCFIFLKESETAGPWIATAISVMVMCAVISYIRIKEIWSIKVALCVMGCFGLVQLIILGTIETPYYWKGDDEWFLRLASGFFSQPLFCLIGYGIARRVEEIIDDKTSNMITKIQSILKKQISALEEISRELIRVSGGYKRTDGLLNLIGIITDSSLEQSYVDARNMKDKEVLNKIGKIALDNKINISFQGKTTSSIKSDVEAKIKEKKELLSEVSKARYTRKDYGMLRAKLRMINKEVLQ